MRWRIGVLLFGILVWFVPAPALAHWDCVDEASLSDPVGVVHLYDADGEIWIYVEDNAYDGLQTHGCYDGDGVYHPQDRFLHKL